MIFLASEELYLKWAALGIELLKIILAWPVMAAAVMVFFLSRYKTSLERLIGRLSEGSVAGVSFKISPETEKEVLENIDQAILEKMTVRETTLDNVFEKAKIDANDAEKIKEQLKAIDEELIDLERAKALTDPELVKWLTMIADQLGRDTLNRKDRLYIQKRFKNLLFQAPVFVHKVFCAANIIDSHSMLTDRGVDLFKKLTASFTCSRCGRHVSPGPTIEHVYVGQAMCMTCRVAEGEVIKTPMESFALLVEKTPFCSDEQKK